MTAHTINGTRYVFDDLKTLLARATPERSGDLLAGVSAAHATERVAAQMALADLPLSRFLTETVIPYELDDVTRLIQDTHDRVAFAPISHFTVGEFRDWLLSDRADLQMLSACAPGITPEMAAAVSKIMRLQDLILVASKCSVVTRFRNTIGLPGRLSTRLQPNHPTDDPRGILASILDGLLLGSGDAVIGINPATDSLEQYIQLAQILERARVALDAPIQTCILAHVTTALAAMERGAPVDLVFQSIGGTEGTNRSFGVTLKLLEDARQAALASKRGTLGDNVMYFETGQGSALSAGAHHGVDQQTIEARAYGVARHFAPLLVNTVVGFIGPEYLYNGKQITRAGLEDHFCGKLLGLPMGCDVCYTNHAEADQDDMDALLTLLAAAGCTYIMGVPGADDVMLNYQSTSFHDALYVRSVLNKRPAPEFEAWLERTNAVSNPSLPEAFRPLLGEHSGAIQLSSKDMWQRLKNTTPARIGLGRSGVSVPTGHQLDFQRAHAAARDAVYDVLDHAALAQSLSARGFASILLHTSAPDRPTYLRRPDLGRRLDETSRNALKEVSVQPVDLAIVIADGLSATAVNRWAAELAIATIAKLDGVRQIAPIVLVEQGRVAVSDEIGEMLGAELVVMLIGERPGLSAADSLGVYVTNAPRAGRVDSERNCISNVRPEGLPIPAAASQLATLIGQARLHHCTGVALSQRVQLKLT